MTVDQIADQLCAMPRRSGGARSRDRHSNTMRPDERKVIQAVARRISGPVSDSHAYAARQLPVVRAGAAGDLRVRESESQATLRRTLIRDSSTIRSELHRKSPNTVCFWGFDTVGHSAARADADDRDAREDGQAVVDAGYEDQVLLSSDLGRDPGSQEQLGRRLFDGRNGLRPEAAVRGREGRDHPQDSGRQSRRFLAFVPKA